MATLVVDGMNVIGARPDGWWRNRDRAARRLLARLQALAAQAGDEVTLVLDGRPLDDLPEGMHKGVEVVYARRAGRDAGDDRLVELVGKAPDPGALQIVTSDRALVDRVRALGADTVGARWLLDRLDEVSD